MEQTLFTGSANPHLAETLAVELGTGLGALSIDRFPDGELHVEIRESVRGHDVYLIQPRARR
jgi:ribose-phosphate pyrophosphokinase